MLGVLLAREAPRMGVAARSTLLAPSRPFRQEAWINHGLKKKGFAIDDFTEAESEELVNAVTDLR